MPVHHQRHNLRQSLAAVLAASTLAACGGGGGGGDGESDGATTAGPAGVLSFGAAPALSAAPSPLPVANSRNVCEGVRFGSRGIENLEVPEGATCVLDSGVRIDGNLELGSRSQLFARDITVGGNVLGQRAGLVVLEASRVEGNVQLDLGGAIALRGLVVNGSIQLVANGGAIELDDNRVGSDIQLFENRGGASLFDNIAHGNLQCKENRPAPTGGGNRAASKEDQCRAL